ncbi:MAG: hypothetical protein KJO38_07590 [Gammaproteobacteria bacterium]|nr:hypothetical protein [Gammaproteobacteria bacterium]
MNHFHHMFPAVALVTALLFSAPNVAALQSGFYTDIYSSGDLRLTDEAFNQIPGTTTTPYWARTRLSVLDLELPAVSSSLSFNDSIVRIDMALTFDNVIWYTAGGDVSGSNVFLFGQNLSGGTQHSASSQIFGEVVPGAGTDMAIPAEAVGGEPSDGVLSVSFEQFFISFFVSPIVGPLPSGGEPVRLLTEASGLDTAFEFAPSLIQSTSQFADLRLNFGGFAAPASATGSGAVGFDFADVDFLALSGQVTNFQVVPLPAGIWMLLTGLGLLRLGVRRH